MIRKARVGDIPAIHQLLSTFAKQGDLLGRSLSELYDNVRDFYVCVDEESAAIVASCAFYSCRAVSTC